MKIKMNLFLMIMRSRLIKEAEIMAEHFVEEFAENNRFAINCLREEDGDTAPLRDLMHELADSYYFWSLYYSRKLNKTVLALIWADAVKANEDASEIINRLDDANLIRNAHLLFT